MLLIRDVGCVGLLGLKLGLVSQLTLPAAGLVRKQDLEAKKVRYTYAYLNLTFLICILCVKKTTALAFLVLWCFVKGSDVA